MGGYKFIFLTYANGTYIYCNVVYVVFQAIAGEFDDNLQWPTKVFLSALLVSPFRNAGTIATDFLVWKRVSALSGQSAFRKMKT